MNSKNPLVKITCGSETIVDSQTKDNLGSFFTVKIAGGATAQCIGLMNAIYLRNKNQKNFKIRYFPYSTGTYWPFAIKFLIKSDELLDESVDTRGLNDVENLQVGKIIRNHPLTSKKFSYEKVLSLIRKLGLERSLQRIRGEHAIVASLKNLNKVNKRAKAVSGGFVPIFDSKVNSEMDERFRSSGLDSPFSTGLGGGERPEVVIHYRIGDKRAKFSHHQDFGGDGIVDPESFKEILLRENLYDSKTVLVLSDEPKAAKLLLESVGIETRLNPNPGDIWNDLYLMSQAKVFIGSWSQVSQLATICVATNQGRSFYPSTTQVGTSISWKIPSTELYTPKFLNDGHWIYKPEFELDPEAHRSYKKPS